MTRGGDGVREGASPSRTLLLAAFAAVYCIWGSTYLGIAVAVETLPPLLMVGVRCLAAGAVLMAWARLRGAAWPSARGWAAAAGQAVFIFGAYAGVAWAECRVPSGDAALLGATSPLFVLLLDGRARTRLGALAGVALGFFGVVLLAAPWRVAGRLDPMGTVALLASSVLWGVGSARSHRVRIHDSAFMATAMELLVGSGLTLGAGALAGEAGTVHVATVSTRSLLALAYLVVFGSLVAYTAFHWLLQVAAPTLVSTHAYVNPAIALALGWLFHGESLTGATLGAAAMVLAGVVVVAAGVREGAQDDRRPPRRRRARSWLPAADQHLTCESSAEAG